jgi:phosphohistidine swiveling domain-containing protein
MATVIPVDDFISDEWYPGFTPGPDHAPWAVDRFRTFSKSDESQLWFLEAHTPRGLTPLAMVWAEDGLTCCPQQAADALPLPPARGYGARLAGTHPYACMLPVTSEYQLAERGARFAQRFPQFIGNYQQIWDGCVEEVERGWQHFRDLDLAGASPAEIAGHLRDARAYHRRAYDIHFDMIFPLTVNHFGFFGVCAELGVDTTQIGKFLQGYDTKIMETDRGLGTLTRRARELGLRDTFARSEPERLRGALEAAGGPGATWLGEFDAFLDVYGWRCEGPCDVALASWVEDPTPALGMIKSFLLSDADHDFERAHDAAVEERETAIDQARSQLTAEEQRTFDEALAGCQAVNLPWWLDDHNYYIDLRVSLPMRWGALAASSALGASREDDTLFLFWPELMDVLEGRRKWSEFDRLITERRDYFDHWAAKRATMPKALGTVPDTAAEIKDPTVTEILGVNDHFLHGVHAAAGEGGASGIEEVRGIGVSRGVARGVARVLTNSTELHRVAPGEVLICEATSPNWTPAFGKIAACVCDSGGMLSHAAVVGREYGIPTVVAVGIGTLVVRDGDEVEVDGAAGIVTVVHRAETVPA